MSFLDDLFECGLGLISGGEMLRRAREGQHRRSTVAEQIDWEAREHMRLQAEAFERWLRPAKFYPTPVFADARYADI